MSRFSTLLMLFVLATVAPWKAAAQSYSVASPDGRVVVSVEVDGALRYSLAYDGHTVLAPSPISMTLDDGRVLGRPARVRRRSTRSVRDEVAGVLYHKSTVPDHFNELRLAFRGGFAVVFRAYDEGAAYRFETDLEGRLHVVDEQAGFHLTDTAPLTFVPADSLHHSYENLYVTETARALSTRGGVAALPLMVTPVEGLRLVITETDLRDYPGFHLVPAAAHDGLTAVFPRYPLAERPGGHNDFNLVVTERADYIAEVEGRRTFPWRIIVIADDDAQLLDSDLAYLLAAPQPADADFSWVRPGKVAWDWWHANRILDVPFESGVNTETYIYYIDFAARNGIAYVNLDEGWSASQFDLLNLSPDIDLKAVLAHAREKGVGVFLWAVARTLDAQMAEAMPMFEAMGVAGLKIDFMDRDDQKMVDFYWRTARAAARHGLLVNFHGAYKPAGLHRTYPNVLNREGVRGLEYNKFAVPTGTTPEYAVTAPFLRMLAGPMDYTPGAMDNAQGDDFVVRFARPMSRGTRAAQLAMYVVYKAPLQMLADAPYRYEREPDVLAFLRDVPTVWDETIPLAGRVGEYAAVARRRGDDWYVAALTEEARTLALDLSFLGEGLLQAHVYRDGPNAHLLGEDYVLEHRGVTGSVPFEVAMAPGGGFVMHVRR